MSSQQAFLNATLASEGIKVRGEVKPEWLHVFNLKSLRFLATLHREFNNTRKELIKQREERQKRLDAGEFPTFLESTKHIRESNWRGAPLAPGLVERRVEITGPVDRKMVINALNSGATQFMADFEDSSSPTWENMVAGQLNMHDAIARTITFANPNGSIRKLNKQVATLLVRPRGLHMEEWHVEVDGEPMSASLFDFGLYLFSSGKKAIQVGQGPYYYIPKLESHVEARWWNQVFVRAQQLADIPRGTIRATVLIETILAVFEMDEILYELREHTSGLNCGRWDYIFSYIKKFRNHKQFVLPDRAAVGMTVPFMDSYVRLLIKTCHRRGVHAMGGMAAQIPIKNNEAANEAAMQKVRSDKEREAKAGHDGTWVAHPGLIPMALEAFNKYMPGPNQIHVTRSDVSVSPKELIAPVPGKVTKAGVQTNVDIGLQYIEAWLRGSGCVPINNLMEDAATAEISRAQLWQWKKHGVKTDDGTVINRQMIDAAIDRSVQQFKSKSKGKNEFDEAGRIFKDFVNAPVLGEFLTYPTSYEYITRRSLNSGAIAQL